MRYLTLALMLLLAPACGGAKEPAPAKTDTVERHVPLEGQPNFRDIGGYETADGRTVRRGLVFRSGELPRLTDADVEKLERLGIRTVITFLTETEEKDRGKDRLPEGVHVIAAPISGEGLAEAAHAARTTGDFSKLPVTINPQIHRLLVEEAKEQYATVLRTAADSAKRPLVFHCSHGVHRTGTAAAILLSALGVPWETVREDYLLSNKYRKAESDRRIAGLTKLAAKKRGIPPEEVDATNIKAFYRFEGSYIDASLEEIEKRYGSMEGYLKKGLGMDDETLARLRAALLE